MQKWEYVTAYIVNRKDSTLVVTKINDVAQPPGAKKLDLDYCPVWINFLAINGQEGWELVGMTGGYSSLGMALYAVFKRPVESPIKSPMEERER